MNILLQRTDEFVEVVGREYRHGGCESGVAVLCNGGNERWTQGSILARYEYIEYFEYHRVVFNFF